MVLGRRAVYRSGHPMVRGRGKNWQRAPCGGYDARAVFAWGALGKVAWTSLGCYGGDDDDNLLRSTAGRRRFSFLEGLLRAVLL